MNRYGIIGIIAACLMLVFAIAFAENTAADADMAPAKEAPAVQCCCPGQQCGCPDECPCGQDCTSCQYCQHDQYCGACADCPGQQGCCYYDNADGNGCQQQPAPRRRAHRHQGCCHRPCN